MVKIENTKLIVNTKTNSSLPLSAPLRDLSTQTDTSAIFVTHHQEEALTISDIVGVIRQGHLEQRCSVTCRYVELSITSIASRFFHNRFLC
ncbi:ABC transporter-related protein [Nostoc linckia NIES-25]|nr:ABC transporter-related protein [Nostoc linckia NIES-25]